MKCFNHHDRDAFSIDPITGKGLCVECLEDWQGHLIEKSNKTSRNGVQYKIKAIKYSKMLTLSSILFGLFAGAHFFYLFVCFYFFTEEKTIYGSFISLLGTVTMFYFLIDAIKYGYLQIKNKTTRL
ncbi:hypothetical protein IJD15_06330 [bacterium]|nr:hypothetical protein [bacterium]